MFSQGHSTVWSCSFSAPVQNSIIFQCYTTIPFFESSLQAAAWLLYETSMIKLQSMPNSLRAPYTYTLASNNTKYFVHENSLLSTVVTE